MLYIRGNIQSYLLLLLFLGLQERKETIRGVYSVIDQLSRTHLNTLERLIFHLVRYLVQEARDV